jgi:hypothetical protein
MMWPGLNTRESVKLLRANDRKPECNWGQRTTAIGRLRRYVEGVPTAITAGDLAFLKALYYKNTGLGPSLSSAEIDANMMRQFKLR